MASKCMIFVILIYLATVSTSSHDSKASTLEDNSRNPEEDTVDNDRVLTNENNINRHVPSHARHHKDPVEIPSSRLKLFEQTDIDGDGFVTRQEYALHNGDADDINATDVEDLFVTYDRDNDGKLSEEEFVDQSSPWEVINECEFEVMQKCNALLDQSMKEEDSDWDEPLCHGLQSYLDCVTSEDKSTETDDQCDIEEYILSVKQTALVYRSSGLCPDLEITLDFEIDIEIDYADKDDSEEEYDEEEDEDEYDDEDEEESDYSSDSTSYHRDRLARSLSEEDETISREEDELPIEVAEEDDSSNHGNRECSTSSLLPCATQFESGISLDVDTKSNLEGYRQCVFGNTRHCGRERQKLLLREGLKSIAKTHRAVFQSELTKDSGNG